MIIVVKDEADADNILDGELCCFCRDLTWYWCLEKDVAVCQECARSANPEDVPSKQIWMRREKIAENRPVTAPFVNRADFAVRNQLDYNVPCVHISLPYGGRHNKRSRR
jgi:hypothetical protein